MNNFNCQIRTFNHVVVSLCYYLTEDAGKIKKVWLVKRGHTVAYIFSPSRSCQSRVTSDALTFHPILINDEREVSADYFDPSKIFENIFISFGKAELVDFFNVIAPLPVIVRYELAVRLLLNLYPSRFLKNPLAQNANFSKPAINCLIKACENLARKCGEVFDEKNIEKNQMVISTDSWRKTHLHFTFKRNKNG